MGFKMSASALRITDRTRLPHKTEEFSAGRTQKLIGKGRVQAFCPRRTGLSQQFGHRFYGRFLLVA